jgi:hypothetical protein
VRAQQLGCKLVIPSVRPALLDRSICRAVAVNLVALDTVNAATGQTEVRVIAFVAAEVSA